jgi:hypothetical protein
LVVDDDDDDDDDDAVDCRAAWFWLDASWRWA